MMNKKFNAMKKATVALAIAASVMGTVAPVVAHADPMDDIFYEYEVEQNGLNDGFMLNDGEVIFDDEKTETVDVSDWEVIEKEVKNPYSVEDEDEEEGESRVYYNTPDGFEPVDLTDWTIIDKDVKNPYSAEDEEVFDFSDWEF